MALTRRDFLASSAWALGAGVFGPPVLARGWQQPPTQPMQTPAAGQAPQWTATFTEIRRGVGQFMGRGGTIGYLINAGGVVVVDGRMVDRPLVLAAERVLARAGEGVRT